MQDPASKTAQNALETTKNQSFLTGFSGADTRIRTGDLILTKDALYLLSYISMLLHRATNIYYHNSKKKARGKLQFS